jgi:N-acetylmuramoyl-L-alanine amidase
MKRKKSLKQQLIRDLVRENIEIAQGTHPFLLRLRRRRAVSAWVVTLLAAGTAIFFSGSISTMSAGGPRIVAKKTATAAPAAAFVPVPAAVAETETTALPEPRRIDPSLFQLSVRKIVVDPGHGGNDPGAMTQSGLAEKDVTLDIARRLAGLLGGEPAVGTVLTRSSDETVSLERRVEIANREKADLFLSIHINSFPAANRLGVETFYLGATTDPRDARLARAENAGSGYTLADFRTLLEKVYVGVRHDESKRFAEDLQAGLYRAMRRANAGLENRGVKTAPLVVLVGTQMPAILAEVSCISDGEEAARLSTPEYRQKIADALAAGVRSYAGPERAAPAPSRVAATAARTTAGG